MTSFRGYFWDRKYSTVSFVHLSFLKKSIQIIMLINTGIRVYLLQLYLLSDYFNSLK